MLIFPATNYHPAGYDLVHRDEHMCRGAVFYAPGSASSNMINAHHVSPTLLVYRRESEERACSEDVSSVSRGDTALTLELPLTARAGDSLRWLAHAASTACTCRRN